MRKSQPYTFAFFRTLSSVADVLTVSVFARIDFPVFSSFQINSSDMNWCKLLEKVLDQSFEGILLPRDFTKMIYSNLRF